MQGPCIMIAPYFEQLSNKYSNLKFLKVDVDKLYPVSAKANVRMMPSFFVYENGSIVDTMTGANQEKLGVLVRNANKRLVHKRKDKI